LCGGGSKNHTLIQFLRQELPKIEMMCAQNKGWQGDFIEAEAFAFLAIRSFYDLPLSFPLTTGVKIPLTGGRVFDCD
jgi:anhydro-N-acetylmuramic acid kinase